MAGDRVAVRAGEPGRPAIRRRQRGEVGNLEYAFAAVAGGVLCPALEREMSRRLMTSCSVLWSAANVRDVGANLARGRLPRAGQPPRRQMRSAMLPCHIPTYRY